jgi:hypothetical protein
MLKNYLSQLCWIFWYKYWKKNIVGTPQGSTLLLILVMKQNKLKLMKKVKFNY